MKDLIIVGGGAAGMTAALYASRKGLSTLIISKDHGGQASITDVIENYPGIKTIAGPALMDDFRKQAQQYGTEFLYEDVTKISSVKKGFSITTSKAVHKARAVILAFGLSPRDLEVPGEKKYKGKGVSSTPIEDASMYKRKNVAVIGGGSSALQSALHLSKTSKKVYLVHRRDSFRGEKLLVDKLHKAKNIELVLQSHVTKIEGKTAVQSVHVKNHLSETMKLSVSAVFVKIGYHTDTQFVDKLVKLNKKGEIIVNKNCETSHDGIFAAGDVTDIEYKQVIISAGEGAKAAIQAYKYLRKQDGKPAIMIDWS